MKVRRFRNENMRFCMRAWRFFNGDMELLQRPSKDMYLL